jgi:hypothetical protein
MAGASTAQARRIRVLILSLLGASVVVVGHPVAAAAQNRGVYPLGMSSTGAGLTPDPGFTYSNQLLFYGRDESKDDNGATLPASGSNAVVMDLNSFTWSSSRSILGGARYSAVVTLPVAKNQLTSDTQGRISGGAGFADSFYMPVVLGWNGDRASFKAIYGFLAPTGRFAAGASDNVGSGYWTSTLSSGQTITLTKQQPLVLSAYEMYEFHTTQSGTGISPGDTFDLDYSVTTTVGLTESSRLQIGVAGYEQRQVNAKSGPAVTPEAAAERYAVNGIGIVSSVLFPNRRASVGVRVFDEFANRATFQGFSFQVSGSIKF